MRPVAAPGRWVWGLSGLVTVAALAIPGGWLLTGTFSPPVVPSSQESVVPSPSITVPQRVTSLDVESYGARIRVIAGPVRHVQVAETIMYSPPDARPPAVTHSVSGGRLTLAAPACDYSDCSVAFTVTVPADVTVTAAGDGGPVIVSGVAGANLDSGGGAVSATGIHGPLTVHTDGGPLLLDGITGALHADTGGGSLLARNVAAVTASVSADGGSADIEFTAAPDTVTVSTGGGSALLIVPGGPYAVTTSSDGGPQLVGIAIDSAARRSISVASGGGPLQIESATGRMPAPPVPPLPLNPPAGNDAQPGPTP